MAAPPRPAPAPDGRATIVDFDPNDHHERIPLLVRPAASAASQGSLHSSSGLPHTHHTKHDRDPAAITHSAHAPPRHGLRTTAIALFPFVPVQARMGVIVTRAAGADAPAECVAYFKGSPEHIAHLCDPASLPRDYHERLAEYTHRGLRVLAVAMRQLPNLTPAQAAHLPQATAETGLVFLGLSVLQNRPKAASAPTIARLRAACMRCVMVTGDNILTACTVARECGLVGSTDMIAFASCRPDGSGRHLLHIELDDGSLRIGTPRLVGLEFVQLHSHPLTGIALGPGATYNTAESTTRRIALAISGADFELLRLHCPEDFRRVALTGTVFARMSPDQKAQLIETLQAMGCSSVMCGDGANDCAALRAAHVGVSLSEADAAVAAPFTSRTVDITCVPTIIREGRASLATAFSMFKFMALYSFIQFTSALILYWFDSNLGDFQYLYIDIPIILTLVVFMGRSAAAATLIDKRPHGSFLTPIVLLALFSQIALQALFQSLALVAAEQQDWFVHANNDPDEKNIKCFENTTIFLCSCYLYLGVALAFSRGGPYRAPVHRNIMLFLAFVALFCHVLYLTLWPDSGSLSFFEVVDLQSLDGRLLILFFGAGHVALAVAMETVFGLPSTQRFVARLRAKKAYKNEYKRLAEDVLRSGWPWSAADPDSSTA